MLKHGINLHVARLSFTAVRQVTYRSYIDYSKFSPHNQLFELCFKGSYTWAHIQVNIRPKQEIEPKVGGGPIFRSGPSFVRAQ